MLMLLKTSQAQEIKKLLSNQLTTEESSSH